MSMDKIINDTTDWTPERERRPANQQQQPGQGQPVATDGGQPQSQPTRTTVQAETIQIPAKKLEFWVQVAQLAILVLIMLRQ